MLNKDLLVKCLDYHDKFPFDPVHDRMHHQQVIKTIFKIIREEKLEKKLKMEPLILAASLHDAVDEKRGEIKPQLVDLKKYLKEINVESHLSNDIIKILSGHSFGHSQENIEEKLLYDADKIEYSNIRRIDYSVKAVEKGNMTDEKLKYYFKLWASRVLKIPETLHYISSKKIFISRAKKLFVHIRNNHPRYFPLIASVGKESFLKNC